VGISIATIDLPALVVAAISVASAGPPPAGDADDYRNNEVERGENVVECGLLSVYPENDSGDDCAADPR
jgi:hypothetical protein